MFTLVQNWSLEGWMSPVGKTWRFDVGCFGVVDVVSYRVRLLWWTWGGFDQDRAWYSGVENIAGRSS